MEKKGATQSHIQELISKAQEIEKSKNREYQKEDANPIPKGMEEESISKLETSDRQLGKANVVLQKGSTPPEQMSCNQNQNYPLFFIEKADLLRKKMIKNLSFKERFIAARNLKKLSHEMQQWIHKEVQVQKEENREFYDLLQKREERHFQIDRIIRYLSD